MKCPVCNQALHPVDGGSVAVEGCTRGCGGVWFDAGELAQVDEGFEAVTDIVMQLVPNASVVVDRAKERNCPKCVSVPMDRTYHDSNYHLELDECTACSGIWLDLGELAAVRGKNDLKNEAREVMESFKNKAGKNPAFTKRAEAVFKLIF